MNSIVRNTAAAFTLGLVIGGPLGMASAAGSAPRTFAGSVVRVTDTSVSVRGREAGRDQTLGFRYLAGSERPLHDGDLVHVTYEQRFLGARHADRIDVERVVAPE